jgi:hypothetical protein
MPLDIDPVDIDPDRIRRGRRLREGSGPQIALVRMAVGVATRSITTASTIEFRARATTQSEVLGAKSCESKHVHGWRIRFRPKQFEIGLDQTADFRVEASGPSDAWRCQSRLRVCPRTSSGITEFSQHEAD